MEMDDFLRVSSRNQDIGHVMSSQMSSFYQYSSASVHENDTSGGRHVLGSPDCDS